MADSKQIKKAFKVTYDCRNCNNVFSEEYEKGDEINGDGVFNSIGLKSSKCTGQIGCPHCHAIECPACGSRNIRIVERRPLVKGDVN